MKPYFLAALAALAAAPAHALTYQFDYSLGSSSPGYQSVYYDYEQRSYTTGDISVTGYVETDGTVGSIDQSNIVAWEFTLTGEHSQQTFSSSGEFGGTSYSWGAFDATNTTLSATSGYRFYEQLSQNDQYQIAGLFSYVNRSYGYEYAYFYDYERNSRAVDGEFARSFFTYPNQADGNSIFVGTVVSEVPLPASAALLLAGLAGLGFVRRRNA